MAERDRNDNVATQTGIVTSVDTANYRVKVQISLLHIETDWIRVCSSYVGGGWGLVSLPHVGNEVVVTFLNGELDEGIVTGVLFSEGVDTPPESSNLALIHQSGSKVVFSQQGTHIAFLHVLIHKVARMCFVMVRLFTV